jgi:hypothetical protein
LTQAIPLPYVWGQAAWGGPGRTQKRLVFQDIHPVWPLNGLKSVVTI